MKEELKTIKDLKEEWKSGIINESTIQEQISNNEGIEFSYTGELIPLEIVEGDLKDEAIKWIKWIKEKDNQDYANIWIKHFFNISEEDLK